MRENTKGQAVVYTRERSEMTRDEAGKDMKRKEERKYR